jgi:hypothetical protein
MTDDDKMPDDFARIYGGCQNHPLFKTMMAYVKAGLPYAKQTDRELYLWADRNSLAPGGMKHIKKFGTHFELLSDINTLNEAFCRDYASVFGPRLSVSGPGKVPLGCSYIVAVDADNDRATNGQFDLEWDDWYDFGLASAASAYHRECEWDFAPGEAGTWVCCFMPTDGSGSSDDKWHYNGNLIGFAILYDRTHTDQYGSLGHIWTAKIARRHGIAKSLIAYARQHYPLKQVEGPVTQAGLQLLENVWTEILPCSRKGFA